MQLYLMNRILILLALLMLFRNSSAQLKIGTAPTLLERSALLELNGSKQGLLLPRLIDTGVINTLTPPDGMLIYFQSGNAGRGLYLRKSGFWQRITTDSVLSASLNSWSLTGNTGLTGTEKLGPISAVPLHIITANTDRIVIDAAGNTSILGNATLSGIVTLNPAASATDVTALMLNSSNAIVRRSLNNVAFNGAIQSLDGLTAATQTFGITNTTNTAIGFSNSGTIHNLNIPDADAITRGVITTGTQILAGSKTFNNNLTVSGSTTLTPLANTIDTAFLTVNNSNLVTKRNFSTFPFLQNLNGQTVSVQSFATSNTIGSFAFNSSGGVHTLNIPNATATVNGFVSTGGQTFAGDKTFNNNLSVVGTTTLAPTANIVDTAFLMVNNTNQVTKRNLTTFPFIRSLNTLTSSVQTFAITNNSGAVIGFTSTGSTHSLNIPDADATTRGVVTTIAQTIAGNKTFTEAITLNTAGVSGISGLTFSKLNSATAETAGAKTIGVDASGNVVRTPTAITYYTAGGTANITKAWVGKLTNTGGTGTLTFDISSAGFTNILDIQATAQRNGLSATQLSYVTITTASTSSIVVKLTRGTSVLIGGVTITNEDDPTASVYLRVEGN